MRKKLVSVIIVTWNSEKEIVRCLQSFDKFSSKKYDYEIIVVDNNSDDRTVQFVNDCKIKNCKVYELKTNTGFAKGNNYGFKKISGEYVLLLNPDTILIEDIIYKMIQKFDNPRLGIVSCKLLNEDETLQASCFNFETPINILNENLRIPALFPNRIKEVYFPNYSKNNSSKVVDWVIGAVMMMRSEDLLKVDGLTEDYFMYTEDMDLCKKFSAYLNKLTYFVSDVSIIHLGGRSEIKNINYNKSQKLINNKLVFLSKYYKRKVRLGLYALKVSYTLKTFVSFVMYLVNKKYTAKNLYLAMNQIRKYINSLDIDSISNHGIKNR